MDKFKNLPPQKLSYRQKDKEWRKKHLDWADTRTFRFDSPIRKSFINKRVNYNLVNGIIDMADVELIINPDSVNAGYIPTQIQHYPIINAKLNLLRGEEIKRYWKPRVIITNPTAISEIENNKKEAWLNSLSQWVTSGASNEEEAQRELEKISDYYTYDWQDIREIRANFLLNHYMKELNVKQTFNDGFMDALISAEEIYQCDIVGGEPTLERINPKKIHILKSGYSNKIEDADMIILWDYWSPGRIIDTYYDILSDEDMKTISELPYTNYSDSMNNVNETRNWIFVDPKGDSYGSGAIIEGHLFDNDVYFSSNYTDNNGNIRVVKLYWKSFRKIKKVKSYNLETGEEEYNFYTEDYIIDKNLGEEEEILWINEAWEGTKIGKDIYVNMRPRVIQYNRLSNPSKCHFGIIGSLYNLNESRGYSMVDMMKPYNYLYDVIHDRLNKAIAANWGKILKVDLAQIPSGWDMEKWMYYAKINHIAVVDSFKEGNKGLSQGKLAGMLNNQSNGVIDAETGNYIQNHINLLEFIKMEMSEVVGITRQREGQTASNETVGGIERATLQSSHITEWYHNQHDNVKIRVLTCLLETIKIALKGKSLKYQYLQSDGAIRVMDIPGDEFAECDYGLVVDNSNSTQELSQKLDSLAQAMLQNQLISASTIIDIYSDLSLAEVKRAIKNDETKLQQQKQQELQAQQEQFQADLQARSELENEKLRIEEEKNIRDNETKVLIEQMKQFAEQEAIDTQDDTNYDPQKKEELLEKIRQFNENLKLQKEILNETKRKTNLDNNMKEKELVIKRKQANKKITTSK